ncbi:MAG: hypothetical protein JOZ58_26585 [Acetobacteraceae bacterium]|nr:hypothetical protein [Acetobacteraceae bacterium]
MGILFTVVFSGIEIIWDRQFGFLKETLVAPASRLDIVLLRTLGSATADPEQHRLSHLPCRRVPAGAAAAIAIGAIIHGADRDRRLPQRQDLREVVDCVRLRLRPNWVPRIASIGPKCLFSEAGGRPCKSGRYGAISLELSDATV